ncbi:MAG: N-6 DNA methylase [Planctomycetota bacterium]
MPDVEARTAGPEEGVRQAVIRELKKLGWKETRLQWSPEWRVPDTPHDLTKRERGQKFTACGRADLVAFADDSKAPHALQVIFEFKEPTIDNGRDQLVRYLSSEPVVRMGYWTNGTASIAVYKSHTNDWIYVKGAGLPAPGDDLTAPPSKPPTWYDLVTPNEAQLSAALRRLVATTVATDSRAVRREDQLRELLHVLLVKVESDAWASASAHRDKPVSFRPYGDKATMVQLTADAIRGQFRSYYQKQRNRVFHKDDTEEIRLLDRTIFAVVDTLWSWRILGDRVDLLAKAFQVFRTQAMKSGEGQFLTPHRIIRPAVAAMEITSSDKVIDPACGSGGFLIEALRQVQDNEFPSPDETWRLVKFANDNLYGVDMDPLGVKLTKAMMISMQDGSTHTLIGDAIRRHRWREDFPELENDLAGTSEGHVAESFTAILTNPPFGQDLKVSATDCRAGEYTISRAAASVSSKGGDYADLEIGLVYLELCYRLLQVGGRVGIVLPETYFFSFAYRWLPGWLEGRLRLRGMLNIPMEAFEEFCRAKTNFYIFEKIGHGSEGEAGQ